MKSVFFGTSEFGAIILEKLVQSFSTGSERVDLESVFVVTAPDKPIGRKQILTPSPVKVLAEKHGFRVFQPETISNFQFPISNFRPHLIIVASYGQIIPKDVLDIPQYGALNVHPSLLPKYRGPSPIQTAILNGDQETGVTIMLMDEKIDHGPIVANEKLKMKNEKFTYQELHDKLAVSGGDLFVKTIPLWVDGKIKPIPQDHSRATYTKILRKEDGRIDWKNPAEYIERQVRAFQPWPGTYTQWKVKTTIQNLKIMKILKADILRQRELSSSKQIGEIFLAQDKNIAVQCGNGALIVEELQLEGGKPMPAREFLLGHGEFIGSILQCNH